jgi:hypothetical protein
MEHTQIIKFGTLCIISPSIEHEWVEISKIESIKGPAKERSGIAPAMCMNVEYYMHRGNRYYFKNSNCHLSFINFEKLPFKYHDIINLQFDYGKNETTNFNS